MSQLSLDELKKRVRVLLRETPLKDSVKDVSVEVSPYDEDVVRVFLHLSDPGGTSTEDALATMDKIVLGLDSVDDRLPSVRFADAA